MVDYNNNLKNGFGHGVRMKDRRIVMKIQLSRGETVSPLVELWYHMYKKELFQNWSLDTKGNLDPKYEGLFM